MRFTRAPEKGTEEAVAALIYPKGCWEDEQSVSSACEAPPFTRQFSHGAHSCICYYPCGYILLYPPSAGRDSERCAQSVGRTQSSHSLAFSYAGRVSQWPTLSRVVTQPDLCS